MPSTEIVRVAIPPAGPRQLETLRSRLSAAWDSHPALVAVEATPEQCDDAVVAVLLAARSAARYAGVRIVLVARDDREAVLERVGPAASRLLALTSDPETVLRRRD